MEYNRILIKIWTKVPAEYGLRYVVLACGAYMLAQINKL